MILQEDLDDLGLGDQEAAPGKGSAKATNPILSQIRKSIVSDADILAGKNIATGLSQVAGLPHAAVGLLSRFVNPPSLRDFDPNISKEDVLPANPIPSGEQIQTAASGIGLTFPPGEEPSDIGSRIAQNIGASLPFLAFTPASLTIEGISILASSIGGKIAESKTFGAKNPVLARAIGELSLGLLTPLGIKGFKSAADFVKGGLTIGAGRRAVRKILPTNEQRAGGKLLKLDPEEEIATKNITEGKLIPEQANLSTAELAGTRGAAKLENTAKRDFPEAELKLRKRRDENIENLKNTARGSGEIEDTKAFLQAKFDKNIDDASSTLAKIESKTSDPALSSTVVEKALNKSLEEARVIETQKFNTFKDLDIQIQQKDSNIVNQLFDSLAEIKSGGNAQNINSFITKKLGKFVTAADGKVRFKSGELFDKVRDINGVKTRSTSVESIRQFYSELGQRAQRLSEIKGQTNKIRIISNMRKAILADLANSSADPAFQAAVRFSSELNDKFTSGSIGKILGFARGETPSPSFALENITKGIPGNQSPLESVKQALSANPSLRPEIEGGIANDFILASKNKLNNKIDVDKADKFISENIEVLEAEFPGIKAMFEDVISNQRNVDRGLGVKQVSSLSPKSKEIAAASLFIGNDPHVAMKELVQSPNLQKGGFLDDLISDVSGDPTGKALRGAQSSFVDEILAMSTGPEGIVNGKDFLSRVNKLESKLLSSGFYDKKQIAQLKRVGNAFGKINFVPTQGTFEANEIKDVVARLIAIPLQGVAASLGGRLGAKFGATGGSLRQANILSKEVGGLLNSLTNKQATDLLIRTTFDSDLRLDLLVNAKKLSDKAKIGILTRTKDTINNIKNDGIPIGASLLKQTPISSVPVSATTLSEGDTQLGISQDDIKSLGL